MNKADGQRFNNLMNLVAESYGQNKPSSDVLLLWFDVLEDYPFEAVEWAVKQHMKSSTGQFVPKPADIIKMIDGPEISTDQIIAMGRNPANPLGVFARLIIGSWDLDNQTDMFYLKQRAEEVKLAIPELKKRLGTGQLRDHELIAFEKYNVNPQKPFIAGMPPVRIENLNEKLNQAKQRKALISDKQLMLSSSEADDCSPEQIEEAKAKYKALLGKAQEKGMKN